MRWLPYFILAYVALGLQIGLGGYLRYQGVGPNLVLLAVLFIAMNAPREPALLGCFVMGVMQDLVTQQPPGLFALSYGLIAMGVQGMQNVVTREHPLTHALMGLIGSLICAAVLLAHGWIHPPGPAPVIDAAEKLSAMRIGAGTLFLGAVYTALAAPVVLGILTRLKRPFAFEPPRRKLRI